MQESSLGLMTYEWDAVSDANRIGRDETSNDAVRIAHRILPNS